MFSRSIFIIEVTDEENDRGTKLFNSIKKR